MNQEPPTLDLYLSATHDCGYLPGQISATLVVDPALPKNPYLQTRLSEQGFRRSGDYLYRPHCPSCRACIATRLPVEKFLWVRRHRRTWRYNQDLIVTAVAAACQDEYLSLYNRYLRARHTGSAMKSSDQDDFTSFLGSAWADCLFYEFRLDGRLVAVAVVDRLADAYSAVYTFFDPARGERSLGRFAILYEIVEAQRLGLSWLYLGYWIPGCRQMQYKNDYQPLQAYWQDQWIAFDDLPAALPPRSL